MSLIDVIKRHEGFRAYPYQDSVGVWTFGYGFTYIERDEADYILRLRLLHIQQQLKPHISSLSHQRQDVLVNMAYNLGLAGLFNFKKMWRSIRHEDYETAAKEMLDSKWADQVGHRSTELAQQMLTG